MKTLGFLGWLSLHGGVCLFLAACSSAPNSDPGDFSGGKSTVVPAAGQPSEVKKQRKLEDLALTPDLTETQVVALWGPPDGRRGSGVDYRAYKLDDQREVWFTFIPKPPFLLNSASIRYYQSADHETLFLRQK